MKNNFFKKCTAAAFACFICGGLMPVTGAIADNLITAAAENVETDGKFNYVRYSDHVEIVDSRSFNYQGSLVIPEKIAGLPVTAVGDHAFDRCEGITSITMPDTITAVGDYSFSRCVNVSSIKFSKNLKEAGTCAFQDCSKLKDLVLPDKLEAVSDNMFWLSKSLETVYIPKSVTYIGSHAFDSCPKLKSVTVANPKCEFHWTSSYTICNEPGDDGRGAYHGVICGYRNSTAQTYANECGYTFQAIVNNNLALGDPNGDEMIDSSDASMALIEYSAMSTGKKSTLTSAEKKAADVNKDDAVDSSDASLILQYYSYLSTGGKEKDMEKWLKAK